MNKIFIRNIHAGSFLETFFISAVLSVLSIRFYLYLTNYPKLSVSDLHIAHVLWGGLFMTLAIIVFISYLGDWSLRFASILGGFGFGNFIDEIGKYITADNNYFYQPTIAIIYVTFVCIFLIYRHYEKVQELDSREYTLNALKALEEAIYKDLDKSEQKKALELLKKTKDDSLINKKLQDLIEDIQTIESPKRSLIKEFLNNLRKYYHLVVSIPYFKWIIVIFFIFFAFYSLINNPDLITLLTTKNIEFNIFNIIELLSYTFSILFILLGTIYLTRSRLIAFMHFKRSMLISLLITQVFVFYREQFSALFVLLINIILLLFMEYLIDQERKNLRE